jgi:hypothetical protein
VSVIDETLVKRFVRLLSDRLPGDWIIIGGTVLPLVGIHYRTTLDIDVAGPDPQTASQTIGLMNLAEELGLPVEAINQAGAFFLYRMTDWREHLIEVCSGAAGRVLRPDATLFVRLKLGRMSETDLVDCLAFVEYSRSGNEPIDTSALLGTIEQMRAHDENPGRIARLRVLEAKLQD